MKRHTIYLVLAITIASLTGCGSGSENPENEEMKSSVIYSTESSVDAIDHSDIGASSVVSDADTGKSYEKISELVATASFPSSGTGIYDLNGTPKDWITTAHENGEITAGLGGNNEKTAVSDLNALWTTAVDYKSNYEIHLNDENDTVITCTDFFTPFDAAKPCTVEECISRGWWKADNMVTFANKDYLDNPVTVDDLLEVFGNPTNIYMTDDETYKKISFDSLDEFRTKAGEMLETEGSTEYDLLWNDGSKYMHSSATESTYDEYVLSPNLYGKDQFMYSVFGKEPDLESETDMEVGKTENSTEDNTADVEESIDQIVFPENNGKFTTVTLKNDHRRNYFTIELPSDYTFDTAWESPYEGYTVEQYAAEQHMDSIVNLDSGTVYDNDLSITYDGVQVADDTNTERLARKYPDGQWIEENGLKAYVYEENHIFVSIDSGESVNLLVSFYGDTNKYSLEEYGKYIMDRVQLIK